MKKYKSKIVTHPVEPRVEMNLPVEEFTLHGIFKELNLNDKNRLYPLLSELDLSLVDYYTLTDICHFGRCCNDPAIAFLLAWLFSAVKQGSLCIDLKNSNSFIKKKARQSIDGYIALFLKNFASGHYRGIISHARQNEFKPLVMDDSNDRVLLYFQKYHFHEKQLKERINAFWLINPPDRGKPPSVDTIIDEIYSDACVIRTGIEKTPIQKDDEQIRAIEQAVIKNFVIVSGGPGTGKTALMVNMVRALARTIPDPDKIVLAAPTGRAAQRMTEAVRSGFESIQQPSDADLAISGLSGSTLHRVLKFNTRRNDFLYGKHHPLDAEAVIVDEVSMIDVVMLDKLLQAIAPEKTKLILMGDKDQLPSVEAGAVFSEMTPAYRNKSKFGSNTIVLKTVYRSGTRLKEVADQINKGVKQEIQPVAFNNALTAKTDTWSFVGADDDTAWIKDIQHWCEFFYFNTDQGHGFADLILETGAFLSEKSNDHPDTLARLNRVFACIAKARILTLVRNGLFGSMFINDVMSKHIADVTEIEKRPDERAFNGQIIMITRNDYGKGLYNGDAGVFIKDIKNDLLMAVFKKNKSYQFYHLNALPPWETAFAMTVHKSQGSEFNNVMLVLPDDINQKLLSREIIYTGVTRAKDRILIYGRPDVFNHALDNKIIRQSGLNW